MSYEFDSSENEVFTEVADRVASVVNPLGMLALIHLALGVWLLGNGAGPGLTVLAVCSLVFGGLALLFRVWLRQVASRFRMIVETEGSDLEHLESALDISRTLFVSATCLVACFTVGLMALVAHKFATLV